MIANGLIIGTINDNSEIIPVTKIIVHEKFNRIKLENDIAIIKLSTSIKFRPGLSPICLPSLPSPKLDFVTIAGWGCVHERCRSREIPTILREAVLPVIPNDVAMCWFMRDSVTKGVAEYIPGKLFIVGGDDSGMKSTCKGDSGSPVSRINALTGRFEIIGIVSWSKGCGRNFRPSVWTRVENYLPWIRKHL